MRLLLGDPQQREAFWSAPILCRFGLLLMVSASQAAAPSDGEGFSPAVSYNQPWFIFDKAEEVIPATLFENPLFYDAGVASAKEGLWFAWLEFQPGKGDQLWVGLRGKDGWIKKIQLSSTPSDYANPTITLDSAQQPYLTYEGLDSK